MDLSIDENLRYAASLREVPDKLFVERRIKYLKLMDLDRLEVRTSNLELAEQTLLQAPANIADVQTFGAGVYGLVLWIFPSLLTAIAIVQTKKPDFPKPGFLDNI